MIIHSLKHIVLKPFASILVALVLSAMFVPLQPLAYSSANAHADVEPLSEAEKKALEREMGEVVEQRQRNSSQQMTAVIQQLLSMQKVMQQVMRNQGNSRITLGSRSTINSSNDVYSRLVRDLLNQMSSPSQSNPLAARFKSISRSNGGVFNRRSSTTNTFFDVFYSSLDPQMKQAISQTVGKESLRKLINRR